MNALRHFRSITRLVLVWFVVSIGVAVASPIVQPIDTLLVCTGTGMNALVQSEDGSTSEQGRMALDCPLCATMSAPPPESGVTVQSIHPRAYATQSIPAAHIASRTAAPLPARGPPSL
jgi:hypothetical protein